MEDIDRIIAQRVREIRLEHNGNVNLHRRAARDFAVGDLVWLAKPKSLGGQKISTYWVGPYQISAQLGRSSFLLDINGANYSVHEDQLKLYVGDPTNPQGVPIRHHPSQPLACRGRRSDNIDSKECNGSFFVHWEGSEPSQDSWLDLSDLLKEDPKVWVDYFRRNGLFPELVMQYP